MPDFSPALCQFNAGELSPLMDGRYDTAFYGKGCRTMRNFLPTPQGPAERRGGTRFLGNCGVSAPPLLIPFVRSTTESYVLQLNGPTMYFWYNGALIGTPIGTVYSSADLYNDDGTPALQWTQSADVMYFTHPDYPPQKLQHFSPTSWSMTAPTFADGPWLDVNNDLTNYIQLSDIVGTGVTVTATNNTFDPNCVGQIIRIYQNDLSQLPAWTPGQRTTGGAIQIGVRRRSGPNTYLCTGINTGSPPGPVDWTETGSDTLIATSGDQTDGPQDSIPNPATAGHYYTRGVKWTYMDSGYGVGLITSYTDAKHVTIAVLRQFPLSLKTTGGSFVASNRWQLGAWAPYLGYPSCCCFFRERLTFAGGIYVWMSVAGDFENFADQTFGEVANDNAVTQPVLSDVVNTIKWLSPSDVLLVGTNGSEHTIEQNTLNEPFGPQNVATKKQSSYGGRSITPIRIGGSSIFATRTGRYVREFEYDFQSDSFESHNLTLPSEHITLGGVTNMQWAFNPRTVIWMTLQSANLSGGNLIGLTFDKDPNSQVVAWHNHPLGGSPDNPPVVWSIAVVPAIAGDYDELHLLVQRKINGTVRYYVERMEQPHQPPLPSDVAFYVDCGGTYTGLPTTIISGLQYLEGETVQVYADGQPQADKVVQLGGTITLDVPAVMVQVGYACPAILQPMRLDGGSGEGTAQGKIKRIHKCVWRFFNSLGGKYGRDVLDDTYPIDQLSYSDPPNPVSENTPFYTGDTPILDFPGGYDQEGYIGYINDQPLPVTVVSLQPREVVYEGSQ